MLSSLFKRTVLSTETRGIVQSHVRRLALYPTRSILSPRGLVRAFTLRFLLSAPSEAWTSAGFGVFGLLADGALQ